MLEASAGTGKTRVLVERYVNLLRAGVDPDHILAITFTRKAAAEMRERIIERLREASRLSQIDLARWRDLRERLGDIAISTIDAFCLSLLREFPLEADVDPGFDLADDTEVPRLIASRSIRRCASAAASRATTTMWRWCSRSWASGGCAAGWRRCSTGGSWRRRRCGGTSQSGPRDLTAGGGVPARGAERLARRCSRRRPAASTPSWPTARVHHPQFAMLAADIRAAVSTAGDRRALDDPRRRRRAFRALHRSAARATS